jgi:hypothetical protein
MKTAATAATTLCFGWNKTARKKHVWNGIGDYIHQAADLWHCELYTNV